MTSPAQRHRMRVLAAMTGAANQVAPAMVGGIFGQMMAQLTTDRRRLHELQSVERKIALKRELLPTYDAYLTGVLEGDSGQPDEVLTTLLMWHIDAGDYSRGLVLADYALRHGIELPERMKRNIPALLLDEVAGALADGAEPDHNKAMGLLMEVGRLVEGKDAPDQARAKLHLAIGRVLSTQAGENPTGHQIEMAKAGVAQLKRAVQLNASVGAKKLIETQERRIRAAEKAA